MPSAQLGWLLVAVGSLAFIAQYARSVSTEPDRDNRMWVYLGRRMRLTGAQLSLAIKDLVRETVGVGWALLGLFGITAGAIGWFVVPLIQLDPVAWVSAIVFAVSSGEVIGFIERDPMLVIGVLIGAFAAIAAVKWLVTGGYD